MPFNDRLQGGETPQRVYALCKMAKYKKLEKEKLKNYLVPGGLNSNQDSFNTVYNFAVKGELLFEDPIDNIVKVNLTDEELNSMDSFRKAINDRVFTKPELMFCRFTAWYIARGTKVYSEKPDNLVATFDEEINVSKNLNLYNSTNITAWRTWANYLGFGFVHGSNLIPNTVIRIQDCLKYDRKLEKEKPIRFGSFVTWISETCPELDYGKISVDNCGSGVLDDNRLSVGVSAGLRALHDSGKIKLIYVRDSDDIWRLTKSEIHDIQEYVSDVIIERW
jgi:hypothetical protein